MGFQESWGHKGAALSIGVFFLYNSAVIVKPLRMHGHRQVSKIVISQFDQIA